MHHVTMALYQQIQFLLGLLTYFLAIFVLLFIMVLLHTTSITKWHMAAIQYRYSTKIVCGQLLIFWSIYYNVVIKWLTQGAVWAAMHEGKWGERQLGARKTICILWLSWIVFSHEIIVSTWIIPIIIHYTYYELSDWPKYSINIQ